MSATLSHKNSLEDHFPITMGCKSMSLPQKFSADIYLGGFTSLSPRSSGLILLLRVSPFRDCDVFGTNYHYPPKNQKNYFLVPLPFTSPNLVRDINRVILSLSMVHAHLLHKRRVCGLPSGTKSVLTKNHSEKKVLNNYEFQA